VPRLTPKLAAAAAALDSSPDHIASRALQRGDQEGRLDALQLWTSCPEKTSRRSYAREHPDSH
jgi:hypothetical protein